MFGIDKDKIKLAFDDYDKACQAVDPHLPDAELDGLRLTNLENFVKALRAAFS
jgi:hypothetical protein